MALVYVVSIDDWIDPTITIWNDEQLLHRKRSIVYTVIKAVQMKVDLTFIILQSWRMREFVRSRFDDYLDSGVLLPDC